MIYILLSICCSVIVSIMLKLAKRYQIDVKQAITWNYAIAFILTWLVFRPALQLGPETPWHLYVPLAILFPAIFLVMSASVRVTGIVRTDVAQRLSLLIPLSAAFFVFNEPVTTIKAVGIGMGFVAILCLLPVQKRANGFRNTAATWLYPLVVFLGFGFIDILLKKIATDTAINFTSILLLIFPLSFAISALYLAYCRFTKKLKLAWKNVFCGILLGVFNFGNILFYLKAHTAEASRPSLVFSAMNIGVITLGTLVGFGLFKEKLSIANKIGIMAAVVAILLIAFPQVLTNAF